MIEKFNGFGYWFNHLLQGKNLHAEALKLSDFLSTTETMHASKLLELSIIIGLLGDESSSNEFQMQALKSVKVPCFYEQAALTDINGTLEWLPVFYCAKNKNFGGDLRILNIMAPGSLLDNTQISHLTKNIFNYYLYITDQRNLRYDGDPLSGIFVNVVPSVNNESLLIGLDRFLSQANIHVFNKPRNLLKLKTEALSSLLQSMNIRHCFSTMNSREQSNLTDPTLLYSLAIVDGEPMPYKVQEIKVEHTNGLPKVVNGSPELEKEQLELCVSDIIPKHKELLHQLYEALQLDYFSVSFSISKESTLVIWEVTNNFIPHKRFEPEYAYINYYIDRISMALTGMFIFSNKQPLLKFRE